WTISVGNSVAGGAGWGAEGNAYFGGDCGGAGGERGRGSADVFAAAQGWVDGAEEGAA
ncbi:unnamed protein product, partial [Adineta steineri]